jgi:alpha-amylase
VRGNVDIEPWARSIPEITVVEIQGRTLYVVHDLKQLDLDPRAAGFDAVISEGADHILGYRSPNFVYTPKGCNRLRLLLKNYSLSDDIAFRFSNRDWSEWPLTADKFAQWVNSVNGNGTVVNLG